jgi:hypothetical protein
MRLGRIYKIPNSKTCQFKPSSVTVHIMAFEILLAFNCRLFVAALEQFYLGGTLS